LCHALHGLGITKGDRLAILMFNCHRYCELYYATPQTETLAVPLNVRLSASEIAYILKDSGSNTLFVGPEFLPLLAEIRDQLPALNIASSLAKGRSQGFSQLRDTCLTPLRLTSSNRCSAG
jgi:acyl-CoA synthetase (AMP-forming)/AMP-acid ligase II